MSAASAVVSVLLALALAVTGIGKLLRLEPAAQQVEVVGATGRAITILGLLEIAAAVALIAGIWFQPIGVAGAIGSTVYFTGRRRSHPRTGSSAPGRDCAPAPVRRCARASDPPVALRASWPQSDQVEMEPSRPKPRRAMPWSMPQRKE
jgi:DoxX-like family